MLQTILNAVNTLVNTVSGFLYDPWVPLLLVIAGLWFSFGTGFVQLRLLGRTAIRALNDYERQAKTGADPQFRAADIDLKEQTDFWN